ncbi:hypothetical protein GH721_10990 [Kriegella sp. EG-1]|nr:hypothetical protein [Flavobacteriaceae bacterium EG-1]
MKLTADQIEDLFVFVRKHYVEHYDLQTELVDHLANGIEEQWQKYPERSYKEAQLREFKKFGVFGFADVIKKRSWAMEKRYWKLIFRFYKDYFKLPKVLLLIGGIFIVFNVLQLISTGYKMYFVLGVLLASASVMFIKALVNKRKYRAKIAVQKRYMLEEKIFQYGDALQFIFIPFHFLNAFPTLGIWLDNVYVEFALALFISCYLALCYIMVYIIPQKVEELLEETYPEYKIA